MRAAQDDRARTLFWLLAALVAASCSRATPMSASGCDSAANSCGAVDAGVTPDASIPPPRAGSPAPATAPCTSSRQCADDALCDNGSCRELDACERDAQCDAGMCISGRCRLPCSAAPQGCSAEHAGWVCAGLARPVCLPQGSFPGAACSGDDGCGDYVHGPQRHSLSCHAGTCRLPCDPQAPSACAEAGADLRCTALSNPQRALCLPARVMLDSRCDTDAACASADSAWPLACVAGRCQLPCSDADHWPGYANALCRTVGADFACLAGVCRTQVAQPTGRIAAENALPGDSSWPLSEPAIAREIEGYADRTSVNLGEQIALYVHTREPSYVIDVFRLGYYAGSGARRMLGPVQRPGVMQSMPTPDAGGFVECDWRDPYALAIPSDWVSGIYLAKLTAERSRKQSYIVFVVRDDARASDYLFQSSVTTYQAYNNWGGKSLYDENSSAGQRAARVSFNRPYALGSDPAGLGAGELLAPLWLDGAAQGPAWEYPLLRFLEREGYDVTYATGLDVHENARLLESHRAFLSVGRDAYWTWNMRSHVEQARDRFGTHLGFFSAHTCSWQARVEPDARGRPLRTLLTYKDASDPIAQTANAYQQTTQWSTPGLDLSQVTFLGVQQRSSGVDADLVVDDDASWVLAGTGLRQGDRLPGLLGEAVDAAPATLPAGYTRIMHSPFSAAELAQGYADMVTFAAPSGAWTFSAGTLQLSWGLDDYVQRFLPTSRLSPAAQQLTRNVLTRLRGAPQRAREQTLLSEAFDAELDPERARGGVISEGADALDPSIPVRVSGGRLVITPRERLSGLHHNGLISARTWDLRDGMAQVRLVETPAATSGADTSFVLARDESHWVRFTQEGQWLLLQIRSDFGVDTSAVPYVAASQRVLRLRHERATDTWIWETSPDGVSFVEQRRSASAFPVSALRWGLEAGTYQASDTVGSASFDDLQLASSGFADAFEGARRAEHWTPGVLSEGGDRYDLRSVPIQHGGALTLRAAPAAGSGTGYVSARSWDMTGGELRVELAQAATADASSVLGLVADAQSWIRFEIADGMLRCQDQTEAGRSQTESSYDANAHRHLRIKHHRGTDTLTWEVSPDGSDWTVLRSRSGGLSLRNVHAELALYTTAPATQQTTVFQGFSLHSGIFDP